MTAREEGELAAVELRSGLGPDNIRSAASTPGFIAGVLDYVVSDEPLLIALAKELNTKPEDIMGARWTLSPSEFE